MKKFILVCIFLLCCVKVGLSAPAQLTASWGANTEGDLAGYELHYGEQSDLYIIKVVMPKQFTTYTIGGLEEGKEYFFALTAFDVNGNISGFSEEVSKFIPIRDTIAPNAPIDIIIPEGSSISINIGQ